MIVSGTVCALRASVQSGLLEHHSARRLRIRTRCASIAEFVARYAVKTDEESIHLALNRTSSCGTRPFAIFLDNDTPVLWGIAELDVSDPSAARLRFVQLGDESVAVHEQLLAERLSNEPTSCWSKLPLPPPPVTRVARRQDVCPPEVKAAPDASPVSRPASRVRFAHGVVIAALVFFAGSWVGQPSAEPEAVVAIDEAIEPARAERVERAPMVTPMLQLHDQPQPPAVADTDSHTKRHKTRNRRR
jgi:hypothetical protein